MDAESGSFGTMFFQRVLVLFTLIFTLNLVRITETRRESELVHRLEPQLRQRATALRNLAFPLPGASFDDYFKDVARQRVPVHAETERCRQDSQLVVDSIVEGETWALRMFDASSKLQSGLLDGLLIDLGNYNECIETIEPKHKFTGQHCLVETRGILPPELHEKINYDMSVIPPDYLDEVKSVGLFNDLMFSVCVPSSCSAQDVKVHMDHVLAPINASSVLYETSCSTNQPLPFRLTDYIAVIFFIGILALVVWSSVVDLLSSEKKSDLVEAFSLQRSWRQLVILKDSNADDIPCLHGLRVLLTAAIILVHSTGVSIVTINTAKSSTIKLMNSYYVAVLEGLLFRAVDVFFLMGGIVRAHSFLQERSKGRQLNFLSSIGRRYFRYTPTLAVLMLYTATLLIHSSSGPMWGRFMGFSTWSCRTTWITGILHISNYIYPVAACVGESWYLAADFQMFALSPLFLVPLYKRPQLGKTLLMVVGAVCLAVYATVSYVKQVDAGGYSCLYNRHNELMSEHYFQTHLRLPAYLLGLGLGYAVFSAAQAKKRIELTKIKLLAGWTVAIVFMILPVYASKIIMTPNYQYTPWLDVYHNAFTKLQVAAVGAWIILVCTQGYGGLMNDFLCWRGFQPLAKLSLGIYLVNFGLIFIPFHSQQTKPLDINISTTLYYWLAALIQTTMIALPLHLCIEMPFYKLACKYFATQKEKNT
ncbi:O-acyltransferase like protein-like [Macrosteles quadrilineatus]|uniref:O-acyltransferase like protein-like n=1 Tax=Macrosteles quadrilineatus TaxID=74068 RepID=UPI0023E2C11B|nr:O-acyltransferase like protein-like [Macrosteles quadrilineatus]